MAEESINQQWKAIGNIIPSLSLNKHPRAVEDYSLIDAVNFRLSDDKTVLQNEESLEENQYISNFLNNVNYFPKGYNLIWCLSCNNELILFVQDLSIDINHTEIDGRKNLVLLRYNENNNTIAKVYTYLTYCGGKFCGTYTYNVDNSLIICFCEYDVISNFYSEVKIINLGTFINPIIDNNGVLINNTEIINTRNYIEDHILLRPKVNLPTIKDINKVVGSFYGGYIDIYISYVLNDYDESSFFLISNNLRLIDKTTSILFKNDTSNKQYNDRKVSVSYDNEYDIKNYTLELNFSNLDTSYEYYYIGVIVHNKTSTKFYKSDKILTTTNIYSFLIDNFKEEKFDTSRYQNYYDVHNIINRNNIIYCSNFKNSKYKKQDIINEINNIKNNIKLNIELVNPNLYSFGGDDSRLYLLNTSISKKEFSKKTSFIKFLLHDNFSSNSLKRYIFIESCTEQYNYNSSDHSIYNFTNGNTYIYDTLENTIYTSGYTNGILIEGLEIFLLGVTRDYNGTYTTNDLTYILYKNINDIQDNTSQYGFYYRTALSNEYLSNNKTDAYLICIGYKNPTSEGYNIIGAKSRLGLSNYGTLRNIYTSDEFTPRNPVQLNIDSINFTNILNPNLNSLHTLVRIQDSYYDSLFLNKNTSILNRGVNVLKPLQIYDFYINLVDEYGKDYNGIRISNTKNHLYNFIETQQQIFNEYTLLYINGSINNISYDEGYYACLSNSIMINNVTFYKIKDLYKTVIQNAECYVFTYDDSFNETNIFKIDDVRLATSYNIGLFTIIDGVADFTDVDFGVYINNNNDKFFTTPIYKDRYKVPILTIDTSNINSTIFKHLYITIQKPVNNVLLQSIGNLEYGIVFDNLLNLYQFTGCNFMASFNDNNVYENYINAITTKSTNVSSNSKSINSFQVLLAGEAKHNRQNRSTVLTLNDNYTLKEDFRKEYTILLKYNDFYYSQENDLYAIGTIIPINGNINYIGGDSIPNEKFIQIYHEKNGYIWNNTVNHATGEEGENYTTTTFNYSIYEIVNSGIESIFVKGNPTIYKDKLYILPINLIDSFDFTLEPYSNSILFPFFRLINYDFIETNNNTIIFSDVISDESKKLSWRNINLENYKYISTNKGKIVKLIVLGEWILIHCEETIYALQFKDSINTTTDSLQIVQSSIQNINYKEIFPTDKGYAGLQDIESCIIGTFGYIFYENNTNRILRFDNNSLQHIDAYIYQWLQKYKPSKIIFADDIKRNRLLINITYNVNNSFCLIYDYIANTFIGKTLYNFVYGYNTKNTLYLQLQHHRLLNTFVQYNFDKTRFDNIVINNKNFKSKLSFVVNTNYNIIKFLENLIYKCYKQSYGDNINIDYTNSPVEGRIIPYASDAIRIYNDIIDTGWIEINNDKALNDKEIFNEPYYYLGNYHFNYLRNKEINKNYDKYNEQGQQIYNKADDKSRLYGNFFIIEFAFKNTNNKIEFETLKLNI